MQETDTWIMIDLDIDGRMLTEFLNELKEPYCCIQLDRHIITKLDHKNHHTKFITKPVHTLT